VWTSTIGPYVVVEIPPQQLAGQTPPERVPHATTNMDHENMHAPATSPCIEDDLVPSSTPSDANTGHAHPYGTRLRHNLRQPKVRTYGTVTYSAIFLHQVNLLPILLL
jgi:hypothetical protein